MENANDPTNVQIPMPVYAPPPLPTANANHMAQVHKELRQREPRQRAPLTSSLFPDSPLIPPPAVSPQMPAPQAQRRFSRGPTLAERWEDFSNTKRWKQIRRFLTPTSIITALVLVWVFYMITDFVVVHDGEAYSPKTKCQKPLILFKDSSLRGHKTIPYVDTENQQDLTNILATSACYLQHYPKNMSCITPLAYGTDMRIISMRKKNGDIIHLINPRNPTKEEKDVSIPETSTLFPHSPPAMATRPKTIRIEYTGADLKTSKTERFDLGDSFCVRSSLDLFDHKIPQSLIEGKQEPRNH